MTTAKENPENGDRLLSSEEQQILAQVATGEPPHSWRAQALLAINEGATQAEAGQQNGLTKGQVRYWLGMFREKRTSIFPDELPNQARKDLSDSSQGLAETISLPEFPDREQDPGEEEVQLEVHEAKEQDEREAVAKKKDKKKPKKDKKSKKTKRSKQDKKAKKGKKSNKKPKKKRSKKRNSEKRKSSKRRRKKSKK